jgi:general secretion pathway protein A
LYIDFWKLKEKPFENTPDPKFFYSSPEHQEAKERLEYVVQENKGAALLTGDYGCGKTMLLRKIVSSISPERFEVAYLGNPRWSPEEMLKEVLFQLEEENPPSGILELGRKIEEVLFRNIEENKDTLIIIDEAQLIQSDRVLEELRLLLNFQLNDRFMITMVMAGQPELRERVMAIPQLEQRMFIKYHLHTFDYDTTKAYINHRLRAAGAERPIFTDDALETIYHHSFGTPRRINNICDISLLVGFQKKLEMVDSNLVKTLV